MRLGVALAEKGAKREGGFSQEQPVGILGEADKVSVAKVAKRHAGSERTPHTRAGRMTDDAERPCDPDAAHQGRKRA